MANGVIQKYQDYKNLSQDEKDLFMFERISLIPGIKNDIKALKSWKVKVVGIATGVSAVLGFISGKLTDLFN